MNVHRFSLAVLLTIVSPALANDVSMFFDSQYVDETFEALHMRDALTAAGHNVIPFSGTSLANWNDAMMAASVLVVPELDGPSLLNDLDSNVVPSLVAYVNSGGVFVQAYCTGDADVALLNSVVGANVSSCDGFGEELPLDGQRAAGTPFAGGPALLPYAGDVNALNMDELTVDARAIYHDSSRATVVLWPRGGGRVIWLGFDFFDVSPEPIEWFEVLERAVTEIIPADCNDNGISDIDDIQSGVSPDCNGNYVPDECELADGSVADLNENGIPDVCDPDCNGNLVPDDLDIGNETSSDCNANQIPDECELGLLPGLVFVDRGADAIGRASLGGGTAQSLVTGLSDPRDVALSAENHMMFWSDTLRIYRAQLDAAGQTVLQSDVLASGLNEPSGIWYDKQSDRVFWADEFGNKIQSVSSAGGVVQDELTGLSSPRDVVVTASRIFWIDRDALWRVDRDGSNTIALSSQLNSPARLTLNPEAAELLWTDRLDNVVYRIGTDGTGFDILLATESAPYGIDCDPASGRIYWSADFGDAIFSSRLSDCTVTRVLEDLSDVEGVAVAGLGGGDCNGDGVPDSCQLEGEDCNQNDVLDECELDQADCDGDGLLDICQASSCAMPCCHEYNPFSYEPDCIRVPSACRHVLILPGKNGVIREDDRISEIEDAGSSVQPWDWTELPVMQSLSYSEMDEANAATREAGRLLAERIRAWRECNPTKSLTVIGSGEGALILQLACAAIDESGDGIIPPATFDRVMFVSATIATSRSLERLAACTRNGIFNSFSVNELTLTGWHFCGAGYEATIVDSVPWPAAGRFGYRPQNRNAQYITAQLPWTDDPAFKLDNIGTQYDAFSSAFFDAHMLPVLVGLPVPPSWEATLPDTYEDGPSPPLVEGPNVACVQVDPFNPDGLAINELSGRVIWTDSFEDSLSSVKFDATDQQDLGIQGLSRPLGIDVDSATGRIYWVDAGTDSIWSSDANGVGAAEIVSSGLVSPVDIVVDSVAGKLYWTDTASDDIKRCNLDGSAVEVFVTGLSSPQGIGVDPIGGRIYWSDDIDDAIYSSSTVQPAPEVIVEAEQDVLDLIAPAGLDVDATAGRVYWTDWLTDTIYASDLDGENVEQIVDSGLLSPRDVAVDEMTGRVYWLDDIADSISSVAPNGTGPTTLLSSQREAGCIEDTSADYHVIVLPGILGSGGEETAIELLNERPDTTSQLWDWTNIVEVRNTFLFDRLEVNAATRAAGVKLANAISQWQASNSATLHIVAGSGGVLIVTLACEARRPNGDYVLNPGTFGKVVFNSGAMSTSRSLRRTAACASEGIFNYYSSQDSLLTGVICIFGFPINVGVPWPAVGRYGFRECSDSVNLGFVFRQLGWQDDPSIRLDNDGRHLKCYSREFFATYYVDMLAGGATPDAWLAHVQESYFESSALESCPVRFTGDMNCDGFVNGRDIGAFVLALTAPEEYSARYPQCDLLVGDGNADSSVDLDDIAFLVDALINS